MQKQNDLALNLLDLFEPSSYKDFDEGFFVNKPEMKGYYFIFKNMKDPKFCLILNTNEKFKYPSVMSKINDYLFIIFNVRSIEDFLNSLTDGYMEKILSIIDENMNKQNTRNLPYGYYYDENGELRVDLRKAQEVRKIFDLYIDTQSVREVATELETNFSDIRDILHDSEQYLQMQPKIVSVSKLKEVMEIMAGNVRGGAIKKVSLEDEVREARRKRKEMKKQNEMN